MDKGQKKVTQDWTEVLDNARAVRGEAFAKGLKLMLLIVHMRQFPARFHRCDDHKEAVVMASMFDKQLREIAVTAMNAFGLSGDDCTEILKSAHSMMAKAEADLEKFDARRP